MLCYQSAMQIMKRLPMMADKFGAHCMEMDIQYLQKILDDEVDFSIEEYTAMVGKFMEMNTMALNDYYDHNIGAAEWHTRLLMEVLG